MTDGLAGRFPALTWGTREWHAVMSADDGIVNDLLDDMARFPTRGGRTDALTAREREFLQDVAVGSTYTDVASRYGVSPETVKATLLAARNRLGARNTTHAVAIAVAEGAIDGPKRNAR